MAAINDHWLMKAAHLCHSTEAGQPIGDHLTSIAYRQLQDLRLAIVQEMGHREPAFRFYHCIVYRELIIQALRQRVVRIEQLVALSRQTILQKTLRSGGDSDFSARMVDEPAKRFGGRIQAILDRIVYPSAPMEPRDLVGQEG